MSAAAVTINGRTTPLADVAPWVSALDFLREHGLTGCKEGCAEGECGACSVLVARPGITAPTEWVAVNACLLPIAALDGQELITAEGLGDSSALHPVQHEMAIRGGSQCGYCTPGFVCSMAAEYYRPGRTSANGHADAEHGPNGFDLHALSGNLCRCTGYRPIKDAAYALGAPGGEDKLAARTLQAPPAPQATRLSNNAGAFVRPETLEEALELLRDEPDAAVIAGCTDYGVEVNLRGRREQSIVAIDRLPELRTFSEDTDLIELGAALSLTEIERRLEGRVPLLAALFPQFASRLIRNAATIGGNLGTGSPIGDCPPVLLALDARLVLAGPDGEREVELAAFFTGYRTSVRRAGELIRAIRIPLPLARLTAFHKIAKRRFDDISSVAIAFAIDLDKANGTIERARIGVGGVAATPIRALATEAALVGQEWSLETVAEAARLLAGEGTPLDDHRASAAYRQAMLRSSLLKLHAESALGGVAA
jgi:xanthine dehydrogenase small subunit